MLKISTKFPLIWNVNTISTCNVKFLDIAHIRFFSSIRKTTYQPKFLPKHYQNMLSNIQSSISHQLCVTIRIFVLFFNFEKYRCLYIYIYIYILSRFGRAGGRPYFFDTYSTKIMQEIKFRLHCMLRKTSGIICSGFANGPQRKCLHIKLMHQNKWKNICFF